MDVLGFQLECLGKGVPYMNASLTMPLPKKFSDFLPQDITAAEEVT